MNSSAATTTNSPPSQTSILSNWPESERLKIAMSTSDGTKMHYTLPRVKYEFTSAFNEGMNVNMDEGGILDLIKNGSFRDALYLTTKLLRNVGQGIGMAMQPSQISPFSLRIWSIRFQLMMAFRYFPQLLDEIAQFGELDAPDLYYQFHGTENEGSLVPFSLRLVHAEVASFSPSAYQSIIRVQRLRKCTKEVIRTIEQQDKQNAAELAIWRERLQIVKLLKARLLYRLKDYEKSFTAYEQILAENANNNVSEERRNHRQAILSAMFRMAMQIGDQRRVQQYLGELGNLWDGDGNAKKKQECEAYHNFLKSIFDGDCANALEELENLAAQNPQICSDPKFANNRAICLLYNGRALDCLQLLFNHPGPISEPLALNLGTVSDLVSTNSQTLKHNYWTTKNGQQKARNDLMEALK